MPKNLTKEKINFLQKFGLHKEKDYFVNNLSMLLDAGMTVADAISALQSETKSDAMKSILANVLEDIENGFPVSKALGRSELLSEQSVSLVKIGEESGKLAANLQIIAISEEKNRIFKSKIRSAMVYPGFVFGVTVIVGLTVVWYILPRLASVFAQLHVKLPVLTLGLIALGKFLGHYGAVVIPLLIFFIIACIYFLFYYSKTKHLGQSILFNTPGLQKIFIEIELAHLGYVLGTLLRSGIPVVPALTSLAEASTSQSYKNFYLKVRENIAEGNSFAKSFNQIKETRKYIPLTVERLIVAGEQSGKLADTFLKINQHYEAKIDDTTKNLSVIFEPILLVIVWVGVVTVALSVILPIYSLIGGFNK